MPLEPPSSPDSSWPQRPLALIEPARMGSWRIVLVGIAGACVLGSGLGFVARPETETVPGPQLEALRADRPSDGPWLQVVVDDAPAPIGPPIEVLPPDMVEAAALNAAPYVMPTPRASEPAPPRQGVQRLVKAAMDVAPVVARPAPSPRRATADTRATGSPAPATERRRGATAKTEAGVRSPAGQAKAPAVRAEASRAPIRVAKAEAKAPRPAPAAAVGPRKRPAEITATRPEPGAASTSRRPSPREEGSARMAVADRCGPGCDAVLAARERQLQRAYAEAEAAGVPSQALQRQQVRWQQARAAAAREAPWAVEDVYLARISELRDLTRDARDE